ncbi:hypothetical protein GXW83_02995 [Streptacidiphilus sp. PB12-B1b]|uniref:hypothetical protein n=1 Tax=Streptacidiphilus sp. PB12-B1b TaxID=2705012 RepID=UPI0015F9D2FB|nr:hypothetical protein [Streptacidiphilus sp. PB12-B1b]QMU74886.1 hypothetical protein GXW83_02995 [Streptacidiphilus sp. PB12-B1b]
MQLTGTATQVWTVALAVLATCAALLLWNRVRGPRPVRVLARAGLLVGSYAATALAVLISVNIAYGGLIVSVSDLFSDPNAVPMHHGRFQHGHRDPLTAGYDPGVGSQGAPQGTPQDGQPGTPQDAAGSRAGTQSQR